jgi:suppressor for copper-sensitivity B
MLRPASDLGRGLYGDSVTAPNNLAWQVWQPDRVDVLVADGKTVLVDVTAAWCITCKANKALVLEQAPLAPELQKLVADGDLVLLQADWTRPNSAIADYLASYQCYGIPFNMVYGPAAPAGIRLGEILTASDVREALRQAMAGS